MSEIDELKQVNAELIKVLKQILLAYNKYIQREGYAFDAWTKLADAALAKARDSK